MAKLSVFTEGQRVRVPLSFETVPDGNPYIPTSIEYKFTDVRTGKVYQDWTNIAPAVETSFVLPALAIESKRRRYERKEIAVRTDSGTETQNVEIYRFHCKNIKAL